MDKSTHEVRLARWRQIIEQCQARPKGLAAKQWLAEHDINEKTYYYWLRKIRKNIYDQSVSSKNLPVISEEPELTFAQLPDSYLKEHTASSSFEPVAVIKTTAATMAVSNGISDQLLERLFQVLSHA